MLQFRSLNVYQASFVILSIAVTSCMNTVETF